MKTKRKAYVVSDRDVRWRLRVLELAIRGVHHLQEDGDVAAAGQTFDDLCLMTQEIEAIVDVDIDA